MSSLFLFNPIPKFLNMYLTLRVKFTMIKMTKVLLQPALSGTRGNPEVHGPVPGDMGSSECEDIKHFDKTPEAFRASELEFDKDKSIIERVLVRNYEQSNKSNLKTMNDTRPLLGTSKKESTSDLSTSISNDPSIQSSKCNTLVSDKIDLESNSRELNHTTGFSNVLGTITPPALSKLEASLFNSVSIPSSSFSQVAQTNPSMNIQFHNTSPVNPSCTSSSNAIENREPHANSSSTGSKLPSLSHHVPTSSVQRSFQTTTLSQFTPKGTPLVTHAFHNLGPKVLEHSIETLRYGRPSTVPTSSVSTLADISGNSTSFPPCHLNSDTFQQ